MCVFYAWTNLLYEYQTDTIPQVIRGMRIISDCFSFPAQIVGNVFEIELGWAQLPWWLETPATTAVIAVKMFFVTEKKPAGDLDRTGRCVHTHLQAGTSTLPNSQLALLPLVFLLGSGRENVYVLSSKSCVG